MAKASEVIALAKSWVGKKEADGSFKVIIDTYNTQNPLPRSVKVQYENEWCATFISALAVQLKCTNIMPTECSCGRMIDKYKNIGCWVENENRTPNVGDIIFYDYQDDAKNYATTDNQGWPDHVGIVEKVNGKSITVIEGNLNSAVGKRVIGVNAKNIRGYAIPKYEKEATVAAKPSTSTSAASPSAYYPKYYGSSSSLDTILKAIGVPAQYYGSWSKRRPIAKANGISLYVGTASQNTRLKQLAKEGKLKRV